MQTYNLQAFITVAELGSFSRAAEQLFLSQSTISKRVATLEQELKCQLFDRIGHRICLTEAGQTLLPRAKQIIDQVEDSRREIHNLSGEVRGTLSLGTSHHIGLHRLPEILKSYTKKFPQVKLDLHFMDSEAICEAVLNGTLEIGIATLPDEPAAGLETTLIWDDPLHFVCGNDYPFATNNTVTIEELANHPAILPPKESATHQILARLFEKHGHQLKTSIATNNLETIKMMVSINLGWSLLPQTMLCKSTLNIKVNKIKLQRRLGVVRNRNRSLSSGAARLIELLMGNTLSTTKNGRYDNDE